MGNGSGGLAASFRAFYKHCVIIDPKKRPSGSSLRGFNDRRPFSDLLFYQWACCHVQDAARLISQECGRAGYLLGVNVCSPTAVSVGLNLQARSQIQRFWS